MKITIWAIHAPWETLEFFLFTLPHFPLPHIRNLLASFTRMPGQCDSVVGCLALMLLKVTGPTEDATSTGASMK